MNRLWAILSCTFLFTICSGFLSAELKPEHRERLRKIQLIVLDVDGTLSDGQIHYCNDTTFTKGFHVHDRVGILLGQRAGLEIAIITSENSEMIRQRAQRLHIRHLITDCKFKRRSLEDLAFGLHVPLEAVCYVGDDVLDEEAMLVAGFRACPSDAVPRIQKICDFVCSRAGGRGAVREVIELVLEAQGKPNTLSNLY